MPNTYVNKVELANGETVIDITDTTAQASDVAEGKYFYAANGQKMSGTAVPGGGGTAVIVDTTDAAGGTIRTISTEDEVYLQGNKTATPTETVQTILPDTGYTALSQVTVNPIPSSYIIPSGTYSISQNGTYNVEAFAQAEIMVQGGGGFTADEIALRTISGSIGGNASYVYSYAFFSCIDITAASFPSCTSIGSSAFDHCNSLTTISFPLCSFIGSCAFSYCRNLTVANFPSCKHIEAGVFYGCSELTTASFPLCSFIGTSAFNRCSKLTTVSFPLCTYISNDAFLSCSALTTISFPLCSSIGGSAFYYCIALTTAFFPSCVIISSSAFNYCRQLTTAIFQNTTTATTSIYAYAFRNCVKLLSLYLLGNYIYGLTSTAFSSTPISGYTTSTGGVYGSIFVPESLYSTYISAANWSIYSARIASLTSAEVQNVITYGRHDP